MPSHLDTITDLEALWAFVETELSAAATDPQSAFKWPILSTVKSGKTDLGPPLPDARMVVCRAYDADTATVRFYSDQRASKVSDLTANPQAHLLFFDREHMLQVRAQGKAHPIEDQATVDMIWANIPAPARMDYTTQAAPGTALASPHNSASMTQAAPYFAAFDLAITRFDILLLSRAGHRRFERTCQPEAQQSPKRKADIFWANTWLTP